MSNNNIDFSSHSNDNDSDETPSPTSALTCVCENSPFDCSKPSVKWSKHTEYKQGHCIAYLGSVYIARQSNEGVHPTNLDISFIFWKECGICPTPTPTPGPSNTPTPTPTVTPTPPLGVVYTPCEGIEYSVCD